LRKITKKLQKNLKEIAVVFKRSKITRISQATQKIKEDFKIVRGYHNKVTENHGYHREIITAHRKSNFLTSCS
jgi:hypothetical protein